MQPARSPDPTPAWRTRCWRTSFLIDALIYALSILPFLTTRYLPLTDLPVHLARQYIVSEWSTSAGYQTFYTYHWGFIPNLGVDIFVLGVRDFIPLELAVRLFCIIGVSALFFGCRAINQFYSPAARAYRFAPFLCYGGPVQFGFINYFCGVGFSLLLFALYVRLRTSRLRAFLILAPLGLLLLFCHIAAFSVWAVAIGSFELAHALDSASIRRPAALAKEVLRKELNALWVVLPAMLLYAVFHPADMAGTGARWSTLHEKIEGIAAITLFANPGPELLLLSLALVGFAISCLIGLVSVRRENVAIFIALLVCYLFLPRVGAGGGYVDYRIPWAASFYLLSGVVPAQSATVRWVKPAFAAFLSVLVVARVALIAVQWHSWDTVIAGVVKGLGAMQPASRLFAVVGNPGSTSIARRPPLENMPAYAIAYRQAFWNGMFADFPGETLSFRPPYRSAWREPALVDPGNVQAIDPKYQYMLVLRPEFVRLAPKLNLVCIAGGTDFKLFLVSTDPVDAARRDCPGAS